MSDGQAHEQGTVPLIRGPVGGIVPIQPPRGPRPPLRSLTPLARGTGGRAVPVPVQVGWAAMYCADALMETGWVITPRGECALLRNVVGGWPRWVPAPRLQARLVLGGGCRRLWWHWTAPAWVADVPVAPLNHHDQVLPLLRSSLPKLTAAAGRVPAP